MKDYNKHPVTDIIRLDLQDYFDKYVYGWMCQEIEIELKVFKCQKRERGGNLISAMALLAFTEQMGRLYFQSQNKTACPTKRFNLFFDLLGEKYAAFRKSGIDVYDTFRCGILHEFSVKGTCTIAMLDTKDGNLEVKGPYLQPDGKMRDKSDFITRPIECGIGQAKNGSYYFVVEKYYIDFRKACDNLKKDLIGTNVRPLFTVEMSPYSGTDSHER